MIKYSNIRTAAEALNEIAHALDVPPSKYQEAHEHYHAVGQWLDAEDSDLRPYRPEIFAQGSFALGTAIKPVGDSEYDVDAVCLLQIVQEDVSQRELKEMVGRRLKSHGKYREMVNPDCGGRRCWTLQYADGSKFHLDILPAIPDQSMATASSVNGSKYHAHAIHITDSTTWDNPHAPWPKSNPKGYAEWFRERMSVVLNEELRKHASIKKANVAEIMEYEVRTPLQRLVQILKRHRDERFGDDEHKPISIVITTLAALAYENEGDLATALTNVIPKMRGFVTERNGVYWVQNPVNHHENFADRWILEPKKREFLFSWLDAVERDYLEIVQTVSAGNPVLIETSLRKSFGDWPVNAAFGASSLPATTALVSNRLSVQQHRESPTWPMQIVSTAPTNSPFIRCRTTNAQGVDYEIRSGDRIGKNVSLKFNVAKPLANVEYHWQVTNTGEEARSASQLRGEIFKGNDIRTESTSYAGLHYVECYLVRNGVCLFRVPPFEVLIA